MIELGLRDKAKRVECTINAYNQGKRCAMIYEDGASEKATLKY
jgi:hypothetical protein